MNIVNNPFEIGTAESNPQLAAVHELFIECAQSLGQRLCFRSFENELAGLPGLYGPPKGLLLLAVCTNEAAGCVALREVAPLIAEMRRLYVRPRFRGRHLGKTLVKGVIEESRRIGYRKMCLNTIEPLMPIAVAMYRDMGFREIAPYDTNPVEGATYMELQLGS